MPRPRRMGCLDSAHDSFQSIAATRFAKTSWKLRRRRRSEQQTHLDDGRVLAVSSRRTCGHEEVWSMTRRVKTLSGVARRRGEGYCTMVQTTPNNTRPLQPMSPRDTRDDENA